MVGSGKCECSDNSYREQSNRRYGGFNPNQPTSCSVPIRPIVHTCLPRESSLSYYPSLNSPLPRSHTQAHHACVLPTQKRRFNGSNPVTVVQRDRGRYAYLPQSLTCSIAGAWMIVGYSLAMDRWSSSSRRRRDHSRCHSFQSVVQRFRILTVIQFDSWAQRAEGLCRRQGESRDSRNEEGREDMDEGRV